MNVEPAHQRGIHGVGVIVNIVDDGLDFTHPDLRDRRVSGSKNFSNGSDDPTPTDPSDFHGTAVAGITAATGFNGVGGRGIAPRASLRGFNLIASNFDDVAYDWLLAEIEALSVTGGYDDARVFNRRYGGYDNWNEVSQLDRQLLDDIFADGYFNASLGRGALYMTAAGNEFSDIGDFGSDRIYLGLLPTDESEINYGLPITDASIYPEGASFYNTTVSSANADGGLSYYSTVGSEVIFTAPGGEPGRGGPGHVTTDVVGCDAGFDNIGLPSNIPDDFNCEYTSGMSGTSSAAPNASGVAALIMSANPALSARDVRHIMATTARQNNVDQAAMTWRFIQNDGQQVAYDAIPAWQTNAAGYHFHNYFGLGMLDAGAAVEVALQNNSILTELQVTQWLPIANEFVVPDAALAGVTQTLNVDSTLTVEAVQLELDIDHERPLDLAIELISPAGTRSVLQSPLTGLVGVESDADGIYSGRRMMTHHFYGEPAQGDWQLVVRDVNGEQVEGVFYSFADDSIVFTPIANNSVNGVIGNAKLRIYGH